MRRRYRRTTLISIGLAAFLLGLVLAKSYGLFLATSWVILALMLTPFLKHKTYLAVLGVISIGLVAGVWRGGQTMNQLKLYDNYYGEAVAITASVRDDPVYDERGMLDFRVDNVKVAGDTLPGQVRVRGYVNDVRRKDTVRVEGRMRTGFGNYQAAISFAEITVIERSNSVIEKLRREFFAAVYSILPEPQGSLGLGFLVGLRSALPESFDDQLRVAGLTHIVVASGYNLTILVRLSRRLLSKRSKYLAALSSTVLVLAFLAVTGASPSITRAAVVTLLSLAAWYYGRKIHAVLVILLGAAVTAGANPLYIWHDLGWWLSFMAFAGVLLLAPLLARRLYGDRQPSLLVQVGIETLAAQAMATPLIMFIFGDFSLVAPLANILVVPLIPLAMLTTFVAGLAYLIVPAFAGWLAIPAEFILSYIVSITQIFARPDWAQQSVELGVGTLILLYGLVIAVGKILYNKTKMRFRELPSAVE